MADNSALILTKDDARAMGMPTGTEWKAMLAMGMDLVGTGFLPKSITSKEQAAAIMLKGMELRVPPMQALANIVMVQGKPSVGSELMLALIYRDHGKQALRVKNTDAKSCTVEYRIDGWDGTQTLTYTIEDAKNANLVKPGPWQQYPAVMLRWRAISQVAKMAFPETIGGMYTPGELGENVRVEGDNIVSIPEADFRSPAPQPTALFGSPQPQPTTTEASEKQMQFLKGLVKDIKDDTGSLIFVRPNGRTNAAALDALVFDLTNGTERLDTLTKRGATYVIDWATDALDRQTPDRPGINAGYRQTIHVLMQNHKMMAKWYPEDTATLPIVDQETGEVLPEPNHDLAQEAAAGTFAEEILDAEFEPAPEPKSGRGPADHYTTDTKQLLTEFLASKDMKEGEYLMASVPAPDQKRWLIKQITTQEDLDLLRTLFLAANDFREYSSAFTDQIKAMRSSRQQPLT